MSNLTSFKNPVYLHCFCVFEIFVRHSLFHILNGSAHICSPTGSCHGPWNSRVVCWLPSPWLCDWQWILNAPVGFSQIIHTSNEEILYACQPSVMAVTTVNQRAFAFIVFDIGISGFVYIGAIFVTANTSHNTTCRDSARLWLPGWKVSTVAFRLFPRPLLSHEAECNGGIGEGSSICHFTRVPTWWLRGLICTCTTHYLVSSPEYSCWVIDA